VKEKQTEATMANRANSGVPEVTVREAHERLSQPGSDAMLLDVREAWEYMPRRAQGAMNIPMSQMRTRAGEVPTDLEVLVICEHGSRSAQVVQFLKRQGHSRVANVAGGTDQWEQAGLPMERGPEQQ
jgi:rhodanese-related sulfurtransferase